MADFECLRKIDLDIERCAAVDEPIETFVIDDSTMGCGVCISGLREAYTAMRIKAETDPLTGIANRRKMEDTLDEYIKAGYTTSVIEFDLDNFKLTNDENGHVKGDELLKDVAQSLQGKRKGDSTALASRPGGDEFVLVTKNNEEDVQREKRSDDPLEQVKDMAWYFGRRVCRSPAVLDINSRLKPSELDKKALGVKAGVSVSQPGDTCQSILSRADSNTNKLFKLYSYIDETGQIQDIYTWYFTPPASK